MGVLVLQESGVLAGFLPFIAKIMTKQIYKYFNKFTTRK
jgi:hypothetical protein